jgi:hypothetical protein
MHPPCCYCCLQRCRCELRIWCCHRHPHRLQKIKSNGKLFLWGMFQWDCGEEICDLISKYHIPLLMTIVAMWDRYMVARGDQPDLKKIWRLEETDLDRERRGKFLLHFLAAFSCYPSMCLYPYCPKLDQLGQAHIQQLITPVQSREVRRVLHHATNVSSWSFPSLQSMSSCSTI